MRYVTAIGGVVSSGIGNGSFAEKNASNITISSELMVKVGEDDTSATHITNGETTWAELLSRKKYVHLVDGGALYLGCSLSLSGDVGINIFMELDAKAIADTTSKLVVKFKDTVTELPLAKAKVLASGETSDELNNASSGDESSNIYIFNYSIPAKDYCDEITCQFVRSDKEVESFVVKVSDYIDVIQKNSSGYDAKTVALVNAMENYCAAAYTYFAADAQSEQESQESQEEQQVQYDYSAIADKLSSCSVDYTKMGESYLGSSLVLNGKVAIRHYYSDEAVFAQIGVTGYKSVGDIYYYEIENISPADYDAVQANGYSVYSYIYEGLSSDGDSYNFMKLLCAMYEYSVAAENCTSNNK